MTGWIQSVDAHVSIGPVPLPATDAEIDLVRSVAQSAYHTCWGCLPMAVPPVYCTLIGGICTRRARTNRLLV